MQLTISISTCPKFNHKRKHQHLDILSSVVFPVETCDREGFSRRWV